MDFPPPGATSQQNVIPSTIFQQFNDDEIMLAWAQAYNAYAQTYIDWFTSANIALYTTDPGSGTFLDFVGTNLYGYPRPGLPEPGTPRLGAYNTVAYNTLAYNGEALATGGTTIATSDDIYRRCLTWHFYKGDGRQFTVPWMKRRVTRFLYGVNGIDFPILYTPDIDITFTGPHAATIDVPNIPAGVIFQAAVEAGILEMPFAISWTITT